MPGSILFVHQGYELYGSDRTLVQSVQAVKSRWPEARITVLLPNHGPLESALAATVNDVRVTDLAILRKSNLKKSRLRDAAGVVGKVLRARRMMGSYDITYINTVMVMDYILAASTTRRPRILHAHEIPTGAARVFFSALVALSRGFVIFNSYATRRSFTLPPWQPSAVVWNGAPALPVPPARQQDGQLHVLLIGRFNSWKGQNVLLRAVQRLPSELRLRMSVRLVGSVFADQRHFAEELAQFIADEKLEETVQICPFSQNPVEHYAWADIVAIPSIRPEPFGLVAIEAMAAARCVIAAGHGGVTEIVKDGVTGSLVTPGSVDSLAAALAQYIRNPQRAASEGRAGRVRFEQEFEESRYKRKIAEVIGNLAGALGHGVE